MFPKLSPIDRPVVMSTETTTPPEQAAAEANADPRALTILGCIRRKHGSPS